MQLDHRLIQAHQQSRRDRYLAAAAMERLARAQRPEAPGFAGQLVAAAGSFLIGLGTRLRRRTALMRSEDVWTPELERLSL